MTKIELFEKLFSYYYGELDNWSKGNKSSSFIENVYPLYNKLSELSIAVYDEFPDVKRWIEKEINSLVDSSTVIFENKEFNKNYIHTWSRFELIIDYLQNKGISGIDIGGVLNETIDAFIAKDELYKIFRTATDMLEFTRHGSTWKIIYEKLMDRYYKDNIEDNTALLELESYKD